eukprot:9488458-Pyramimonas_sp.AAC.1
MHCAVTAGRRRGNWGGKARLSMIRAGKHDARDPSRVRHRRDSDTARKQCCCVRAFLSVF